jgi:two-component system LytT family response regulator
MLVKKLEEYFPDIELVGECETAETALLDILRLRPDLIFLDIQLPDKNGLWLAEQLMQMKGDTFALPEIIFTTGFTYSEYLLKAFQLAAIDYLVKPIQPEDLTKAITRFKERNPSTGVQSLMEAIRQEKLLKFKNYSGLLLVKPEDIAYIEADADYARIFLINGEEEYIFERLGVIEKKLPQEIFLRAGKSLIVNRKYIRKINARSSTIQISTPSQTFNIEVSKITIRQLKDIL